MKHLLEASAAVRERLSEASAAEKKMKAFAQDGRSVKDAVTDSDVDPEELKKGIEVEYEHTSDRDTAKRIALDHLAEIPDYYTRLAKMEQQGKAAMGESVLGQVIGHTAGYAVGEKLAGKLFKTDAAKKLSRHIGTYKKTHPHLHQYMRKIHDTIRTHAPTVGGMYAAHYGGEAADAIENRVKKGAKHVKKLLTRRFRKTKPAEEPKQAAESYAGRVAALLEKGDIEKWHPAPETPKAGTTPPPPRGHVSVDDDSSAARRTARLLHNTAKHTRIGKLAGAAKKAIGGSSRAARALAAKARGVVFGKKGMEHLRLSHQWDAAGRKLYTHAVNARSDNSMRDKLAAALHGVGHVDPKDNVFNKADAVTSSEVLNNIHDHLKRVKGQSTYHKVRAYGRAVGRVGAAAGAAYGGYRLAKWARKKLADRGQKPEKKLVKEAVAKPSHELSDDDYAHMHQHFTNLKKKYGTAKELGRQVAAGAAGGAAPFAFKVMKHAPYFAKLADVNSEHPLVRAAHHVGRVMDPEHGPDASVAHHAAANAATTGIGLLAKKHVYRALGGHHVGLRKLHVPSSLGLMATAAAAHGTRAHYGKKLHALQAQGKDTDHESKKAILATNVVNLAGGLGSAIPLGRHYQSLEKAYHKRRKEELKKQKGGAK